MSLSLRSTFIGSATALALVAGAGVSCSPSGNLAAEGRRVQPVYYGTADNQASHAAVVALSSPAYDGFFCSGTLITPTVVLTAGHCLDGLQASQVQVLFGGDVDSPTDTIQASELLVHPDYDSYADYPPNDIALLRMAHASTVTPIPALPDTQALTSADVGVSLDFSGFGYTESGSYGTKLHWEGPLGLVCAGPSSCTYEANPVVAKSIAYDQANGGPCSGDSGGPAFVIRGSTEYVAGVTSYGDTECAVYGVSTLVSSFASFIDDFVNGTVSENCTVAGDEDGDGDADCADSDCAGTSACSCGTAPVLNCGDSVSGTTAAGSASFTTYSCIDGEETGAELVYQLDVASGTAVTLTMTPSGSNDLDLFVLEGGSACDTNACLQVSYNSPPEAENIAMTMPSGGAFVVVETYDTEGAFTLTVGCEGSSAEDCNNGVDDDLDGASDCDDTDCASEPTCDTTGSEDCDNGADDDGDGAVDCDDADCSADSACDSTTPTEDCANGTDDDGDGAVDCDDSDCASASVCATGGDDDGGDDGGCGCRAAGRGSLGAQASLSAMLLGLLVAVRRRRR